MTVNEKKSILAFYISKYNDDALNELGYFEGITAAMEDMSEKITREDGYANNYLKQRRDEFDVFYDNGRVGYRNRKPTKAVQRMYENWDQIEFEKMTCIVKAILENLSDQEIMKIDDSNIIIAGLQS